MTISNFRFKQVAEMSPEGTVVGELVTEDPDQNQTFTYTLVNDADGRFMLDGGTLKVSGNIQVSQTKGGLLWSGKGRLTFVNGCHGFL